MIKKGLKNERKPTNKNNNSTYSSQQLPNHRPLHQLTPEFHQNYQRNLQITNWLSFLFAQIIEALILCSQYSSGTSPAPSRNHGLGTGSPGSQLVRWSQLVSIPEPLCKMALFVLVGDSQDSASIHPKPDKTGKAPHLYSFHSIKFYHTTDSEGCQTRHEEFAATFETSPRTFSLDRPFQSESFIPEVPLELSPNLIMRKPPCPCLPAPHP